MQRTRHLGDLLGFVADAFQIGDGLHHGHDHAQVDRGRLAAGDHVVAGFVEFDLMAIDLAIVGDHLIDQADVARFQTVHGALQLLLDQPPICQHACAQAFEIGIELFAD
jgi:hypothetical protein